MGRKRRRWALISGAGVALLLGVVFWKESRGSTAAPARLHPAVEKAVGLAPP